MPEPLGTALLWNIRRLGSGQKGNSGRVGARFWNAEMWRLSVPSCKVWRKIPPFICVSADVQGQSQMRPPDSITLHRPR